MTARASTKWPRSEVDLIAAAEPKLGAKGIGLHREVQLDGRVADLVIRLNGGDLWVIQGKTSLSFDVLAQCRDWMPYARYVSALVPVARLTEGRILARQTCQLLGLGLLEVDASGRITETPAPHNPNCTQELLRKALHPRQADYSPAGAPSPVRWTPAKEVIAAIRANVEQAGGEAALKDAIRGVDHRWGSPAKVATQLHKLQQRGALDGLEARRIAGMTVLRLREGRR